MDSVEFSRGYADTPVQLVNFGWLMEALGEDLPQVQWRMLLYCLHEQKKAGVRNAFRMGVTTTPPRVGVSLRSYKNALKRFLEIGFIARVEHGLYMINPRVNVTGRVGGVKSWVDHFDMHRSDGRKEDMPVPASSVWKGRRSRG